MISAKISTGEIFSFEFCFSEMDAVAYIGVISRTAVLACGFFGNTLMILGNLFKSTFMGHPYDP